MHVGCGTRLLIVVAGIIAVSSACSSSSSPESLDAGLITARDLPGSWKAFKVGPIPKNDVCGDPAGGLPKPRETASVAWAVSPDAGPIFGERLERYAPADTAKILKASRTLALPCDFRNDGARWRTERLAPPTVGNSGHVYLVTNSDRTDSFNYIAIVRAGDTYLRTILNSRQPARSELDRLVRIAWTKARDSGLLHDA
jgi:hypothetical protein